MRRYNRNELSIKSQYELNKIARTEKIISNFNLSTDRSLLIDLILKYREYRVIKRILEYNKQSYFNIQEFINKNLLILELNELDIYIKDKFIINIGIENMDICVYISKFSNVALDVVMLVNKNKYIYAIGYLEFYEEDGDFNKYVLHIPKDLNIINKDYILEDMYLLFLEDKCDIKIFEVYYNIYYKKLINESIYGYMYKIEGFDVNIVKESKYPLYLNINRFTVESRYLKEFFFVSVLRIEPLTYIFGNSAKELLVDNEFKLNFSYFNDLDIILDNFNGEVNIYDGFMSNSSMRYCDIFYAYVEYFKKKVENLEKVIYKDIVYITEYNLPNKIDKLQCFSLSNIDINKNIQKYIFINIDDDGISILENKYSNEDYKVAYKININSEINLKSDKFSNFEVIKYIMYYFKLKLFDNSLRLFDFDDNIFFEIKNNFDSIEEKLMINLEKTEINNPTQYFMYYENKDKYQESKKNYEMLKYISQKVFDSYIDDKESYVFKVKNILADIKDEELKKLSIFRNEIDEIITYLSYNIIHRYFEKYNISEILKKFAYIKMNGKLLKTKAFIEVLKEYVPGRYINFKNTDEKNLIQNIYEIEKHKIKGNYLIEYNCFRIKYKLRIYYNDYNKQKILILDEYKNKASFDKIVETKELELEFEYIFEFSDKKEEKLYLRIPDEFVEMDENDFLSLENYGIDNIEINEVTNMIIRIILIYLKNNVRIYFIKRIKDQLFYSKFDKELIVW